jgi:hypothetical protein
LAALVARGVQQVQQGVARNPAVAVAALAPERQALALLVK